MVVIYAEKPDMAEKIASVLGGNTFHKTEKRNGFYTITYRGIEHAVTWGYGHLCTLAAASEYNPDYKNWSKMPMPFIPPNYKVVLNLRSSMPVKETYAVVKKLFAKAEWIINATDFDREGELIFYYLYSYMNCNKPVMRAKLSSTTQQGILDAFDHLMQSTEFAGILSSARSRSIADWVVGCNMTAAMTLRCGGGSTIYSIGRVQTPTLAMVVARDESILNFKPEDYFTVDGVFTTSSGEKYKGNHKTKKFSQRAEAQNIVTKCAGQKGTVTNVQRTAKEKLVPNLYSLDTLQMDANSKHGLSIKRTLDITQKLYEKGFVTYPRTDSQYLPEDMVPQIENIQNMLRTNGFGALFNQDANVSNMLANKKRFFDDKKLGSHYAIIPTEIPATNLDPYEAKVYQLIVDSVIRMLYPNAGLENTRITTEVNGEPFITTGTCIAKPGWLFVHGDTKEEMTPYVKEMEKVDASCSLAAKKTEPPKHYTDKTLLSAMISAGKTVDDDELKKFMADKKIDGIGTVATRAGIIETLLNRGVITRDKKNIIATERGIQLIHAIPVDEVKSVTLTAKCEKELNQIMEGSQNANAFLSEIYKNTTDWCGRIMNIPKEKVHMANNASNTSMMCPVCGSPLRKMKWGYGCSDYSNGCKFTVGTICGKMLTENQLKKLLSDEKLGPVSGFTKKDGTKFDATLVLIKIEENGKIVNYKIEFDKPKSKQDEKPDLDGICPNCGAKMIRGKWGWECEKKCGISIPYVLCNRDIEPEIAEALLKQKSTAIIEGFISKNNKPFKAGLIVNGNKIEMFFPERTNYKK